METLDKGTDHVPGEVEQHGMRFHFDTQDGMQFKTYGLFLSGIFHLIFSNCRSPQVAGTVESKLGGG